MFDWIFTFKSYVPKFVPISINIIKIVSLTNYAFINKYFGDNKIYHSMVRYVIIYCVF